ncbi:E3 ubiquitin-protein ligase Rnf220-like [Uranotaenia lowii]|uniref:E3 ubiquitin-protein ligase Rnf220-like n=1 Tax=Uranotaenia lowii TaxID=190385 RepID=UPI00247A992D|nr:E3 ubiquitin-protein ligase Rnf220-like [Uranotaenia lowii]
MDHRQHQSLDAPVPQEVHPLDARHRKPKSDPLSCPICGVTLRPHDIDHHFALEVDRLDKILKPKKHVSHGPMNNGTGRFSVADLTMAIPSGSGSSSSSSSTAAGVGVNGHGSMEGCSSDTVGTTPSVNPDECWGTYQKIKNNRQARLKMKSRKRKHEDNVCPICNKLVSEEMNSHVESCLRPSVETNGTGNGTKTNASAAAESEDDDDTNIDVEGESFEVYEWAGQTRVRTAGAFHQAGAFASTTVRVTNAEDTDDELNVDGDETQIYGPPQYTERDVIYSTVETHDKDSYLRGLVMANEPTTVNRSLGIDNPGEGSSRSFGCSNAVPSHAADSRNEENSDQIIESLKSKIREYEGYIQNRPKCLICMDDFKKPVVSICCWHVYCEECWLHTLGAKKLCPQCSMITSPTDLRRIYL